MSEDLYDEVARVAGLSRSQAKEAVYRVAYGHVRIEDQETSDKVHEVLDRWVRQHGDGTIPNPFLDRKNLDGTA